MMTYNPCDECPRGIDLRDGSGSDYTCRICEFAKLRALGTVEELTRGAALREAQDEGRVVVLDTSRKPLVWGDNDHNSCLCPDCCEDLMGIPYGEFKILQCPACGQYLDATKIITRTEAEAAQREESEST